MTANIGRRLAAAILFLALAQPLGAEPVAVTDHRGAQLVLGQRPGRVVSLIPSITEMIFALNAGDALVAVTTHDTYPLAAARLPVVGGFSNPSIGMIGKLSPDVILLSKRHAQVREQFAGGHAHLIELDVESIADSLATIQLLGRIFQKEDQARKIVADIQDDLELVRRKTARIPQTRRQRVMRIMAGEKVMTPGQDSFQNEMIRAAGGTAPDFGRKGAVTPVTLAEWLQFNPQAIYGCEGDKDSARMIFSQEGWKEVEAVKNNRIFYFPCDLTCRAATQTGHFVAWLSSRIYGDFFSDQRNLERTESVVARRPVSVELPYIKEAWIADSYIYDFLGKTLMLDFKQPQTVLSTLEGWRDGVQTIGNHYLPPQTWGLGHQNDLAALKAKVTAVIGKSPGTSSLLFTGANMDHLAVQQLTYKDMTVWALVTAGVRSNALRMSKDTGGFYEPGTINIILLTNMKLTPRAMTGAIISATEAKTAALQDMDIRSSATPLVNAATGTGTDNIIVAQGEGIVIDNTGGHTKMGELIAGAVHAGVTRAVALQNGLTRARHIFGRLKERGISLFQLISKEGCECGADQNQLVGDVEEVLLDARYAGFMAAALALSDAYEQGLVTDLGAHEKWCRTVAEEIAGEPIEQLTDRVQMDNMPIVLKTSLNAVLNGVYQHRMRK